MAANDDTDQIYAIMRSDVEELQTLWPALHEVVERDQLNAEQGMRHSKSTVHIVPINVEVVDAIHLLAVEIPAFELELRNLLEDNQRGKRNERTVENALANLTAIYLRLSASQQHKHEAKRLARRISTWRHEARTAIGLSQKPKTLGDGSYHCPYHIETRTALQLKPDEATLHLHARPGEDEAITWQQQEGVFCPDCKRTWTPSEYLLLGLMINQANKETEQTEQEAS